MFPATFPIQFARRIPGQFGNQGALKQSISEKIASYSPFLWWKMNETSGTTITDMGSGAHNGTWTAGGGSLGNTGMGDGGTSILFDGAASNIAVAGNPSLTAPAAVTIGVCMKLTAGIWADGTFDTIRFDRTDTNNYLRLQKSNVANTVVFQADYGGAGDVSLSIGSITTTNWFWLFGVGDGTSTQAFAIDTTGALLGASAAGGALGTWSAGAAVWQMGFATQYLNGYFAHMMILPSKLTQAQLQALAAL